MKTTLACSLLAALCVGGLSASPALAAAPAAPAAPADTSSAASDSGTASATQRAELLALVDAMMMTMDDITAVLSSVKDKPGADDAAAKLAPLMDRLKGIEEAGRKLETGPITGDPELEALEEKLEAKLETLIRTVMELAEKDCYGSSALRELLRLD